MTASRLEFARCCGTVCDKAFALRQIASLARLYRLLKSPMMRWYPDRVCYERDWEATGEDRGRIIGVYIPIAMIDEIYNDGHSTTTPPPVPPSS